MALKDVIKEHIYITSIIKQLNIDKITKLENFYLYTDSKSAIDLANNPAYHNRTKHIDIQYHFVREKIINNIVTIDYISTKEQIADIFTKAVNINTFTRLVNALNLK